MRGTPATKETPKKGRYGRLRMLRRRGVILLVVLALVLLALPFLLEAPDTVRRFLYPLDHQEVIQAAAAERGVEGDRDARREVRIP